MERLIEAGDEASLRAALELEPDNTEAIVSLAELCAGEERADEALALLEKIPESPDTRRIAALARRGPEAALGVDDRLAELLDQVKGDDDARKEFVDLLELLARRGPGQGRLAPPAQHPPVLSAPAVARGCAARTGLRSPVRRLVMVDRRR